MIINGINKIEIGDDCYISHYSYLNGKNGIVLEDNVIVGPFSVLVTTNHKRIGEVVKNISEGGTIKIGKGSFLGSHCVVTPRVVIGRSCVIGANAVVTKIYQIIAERLEYQRNQR